MNQMILCCRNLVKEMKRCLQSLQAASFARNAGTI